MDPGILRKSQRKMDSFGGQHIKMRQVNTEVVVMVEKKRGKREMDA